VNNVTFRNNEVQHDLVGTPIQFSGGVFGAVVEGNTITSPRESWMFLSAYTTNQRNRTPVEQVRWSRNEFNGATVVAWDGVSTRGDEGGTLDSWRAILVMRGNGPTGDTP
jgi:hypothetical protein